MFARLTIVQVKVDKIDEVIKIYGDNVVPAAKWQKGYKGILMLTDRKTGKGDHYTGMAVSEDIYCNPTDKIEVLFAIGTPHLHPAPLPENNREPCISIHNITA